MTARNGSAATKEPNLLETPAVRGQERQRGQEPRQKCRPSTGSLDSGFSRIKGGFCSGMRRGLSVGASVGWRVSEAGQFRARRRHQDHEEETAHTGPGTWCSRNGRATC